MQYKTGWKRPPTKQGERMNQVVEALKLRRSCRKFESRQVSEEDLEQIVEAGLFAASGMGRQATRMVVVQNPDDIAALSKMNAEIMGTNTDPFYGAPTVVVVLADANVPTCVEDGSLVMGNLMNAAHAVGVASCWIHRAKEEFESDEGKALLAKWGIEGEWRGVGHCILGYAAEGGEDVAAIRQPGRVTYAR